MYLSYLIGRESLLIRITAYPMLLCTFYWKFRCGWKYVGFICWLPIPCVEPHRILSLDMQVILIPYIPQLCNSQLFSIQFDLLWIALYLNTFSMRNSDLLRVLLYCTITLGASINRKYYLQISKSYLLYLFVHDNLGLRISSSYFPSQLTFDVFIYFPNQNITCILIIFGLN